MTGSSNMWELPTAFEIVYQPIVSTLDGTIHGVEALARFEDGRCADAWFAEATERGCGVDLELLAVERALAVDSRLVPVGAYVAVNVSPETMVSPQLAPLLFDRAFPVVVELTEHVRVPDYAALVRAIAALRARGVKLAVDDAGSGYAGLSHILRLRPDFIKLDGSLVTRIEDDPAKLALASAVTDFAKAFDGSVIAEGVETMAEFHSLVAAGVRLAQGYAVAPPGPLPAKLLLPGGLRAPLVLVVDDDAVVRAFARMLLEKSGFTVVAEADDVAPAIERAEAAQPDIILLDLHLPSMLGNDAVPFLRSAAPQALIVAISADRTRGGGLDGPDEFLPKDDGLADLPRVLRRMLARRARSMPPPRWVISPEEQFVGHE